MLSWGQVMEHFLKSSLGKLFFLLQVFWSLISSFFYVTNKYLFQFSHHRKEVDFSLQWFSTAYLLNFLLHRFSVFKSFIHVSNIINLSGASLVMQLINCQGLLTFWRIRRILRFWAKLVRWRMNVFSNVEFCTFLSLKIIFSTKFQIQEKLFWINCLDRWKIHATGNFQLKMCQKWNNAIF